MTTNNQQSDMESMLASALLRFRSDINPGNSATSLHGTSSGAPGAVPNPLLVSNANEFHTDSWMAHSLSSQILQQQPANPSTTGSVRVQLQAALLAMQRQLPDSFVSPSNYRLHSNPGSATTTSQAQLMAIQAALQRGAPSSASSGLFNQSSLESTLSAINGLSLPVGEKTSGLANEHHLTSITSTSSQGVSSQGATTTKPPLIGSQHETLIRKRQIDIALRSKPQRGRKREDLTELERIELTRTRNREHAKLTRVRKKNRYDELLENEQSLGAFQDREKVWNERRHNVVTFVKLRAQMLRSLLTPSSDESTDSDDTRPIENTTLAQAPTSHKPLATQLADIVHDINSFLFDFVNFDQPFSQAEQCEAAASMKRFDETLLSQLRSLGGEFLVQTIDYDIAGGVECVALDNQNSGLVRLYLVQTRQSSNCAPLRLMSAMLEFDFAAGTSMLQRTRWSWLSRSFQLQAEDINVEDDGQGLQGQVSHPSVVSLDLTSGGFRRFDNENQNTEFHRPLADDDVQTGPGMDI
jgi:hypothetical protein